VVFFIWGDQKCRLARELFWAFRLWLLLVVVVAGVVGVVPSPVAIWALALPK
jgi:uncharacterized membrane protein YhaH (DUF805 family)